MNNDKIQKLFQKLSLTPSIDASSVNLNSITTNLQDADSESIVFYKISNSKSEEVFLQRLGKLKPGLIILNKKLGKCIGSPTVVVSEEILPSFTSELLEIVYPMNKIKTKVFGITGTNGKSTCVNLCEQILVQMGKRAASIGTVGVSINGIERDLKISGTTPSDIDLRRILFTLKDEIDFLFMEVSSHAIVQNRMGDVRLSGAGWTSFSQDHLDYHKTMKEYFEAKASIVSLFENKNSKLVVPSTQNELSKKLEDYFKEKNPAATLVKSRTLEDLDIVDFPNFFKVHYNKENLELCLELIKEELEFSTLELYKIKTPKGRFSIIEVNNAFAIVDYAHTPDALENLLRATKKAFPNSKLITVFGCGGDRDKTKRPLMGAAAENGSDEVIVTSDNPRSANPDDIIKDIVVGLRKQPLLVEADRETAILEGVKHLSHGDVLVIAGKGHEEYQEIKGQTVYFSDFDVVEKARK